MKAASPALIALLNSGADFQMVDLWTITLAGGAVIRWSGGDVPIVSGGHTYALGPMIERQDISEKIGLDVTTVDMAITASPDDLINGVPIIPFIRGHGFDGANVRLDRAFLTDWSLPVVGTVLRFSGRVTAISAITGDGATITVSSWTVLLNANMPANLYQAACLHAVYDAGCALDPAAFAVTGMIGVSPVPTRTVFDTNLTPAANDFAQGRIVFTSGPNTGISATIMSNDGAGLFQLVSPLPALPLAGNTFTAYPGFLGWVTRFAREIPRDAAGPGDLAIWKYGRCYSHAAIVIDLPEVLHAVIRGGGVVRGNADRDEELRSRPVKFFTLFEDQ